MSWGNPWAWLAVAALTVPPLIHMLGRREAKKLPFPTLRFLEPSRLQPVRRTRIQDLALLAIRVGVLLVAVAALAQPRFGTSRDSRSANALARVVIVDTSASMLRPVSGAGDAVAATGEAAAEVARREAQRIGGEAAAAVYVETATPALELAGAMAWLDVKPGRGEIVVLSDFQSGTIDAAALATVAPEIGIDLRRIAVDAAASPVRMTSRTGEIEAVASALQTAAGTDVEWAFRPAPPMMLGGLSLLSAEADAGAARDAVTAAWRVMADVRFDAGRPVAVVYAGYDGRAALFRDAHTPRAPWMAETIRRVHVDALIASAAEAEPITEPDDAMSPASPFVRIGGPATGVIAAGAVIDGRDHLVFFTNASPASLMSAALIGSIGRAWTGSRRVTELDPEVLADSTLASWRRAPTARTTAATDDAESDAPWFWLVALALLAVEALYRRRMDALRREALQQVETAR